LHVLGLPPAFNLSHDQTLQFKIISPLSGPSLAQGSNVSFDESLALMIRDMITAPSTSAHMNYLIDC
ncbi:hypothetical protein, partial [Halomonas sp.]|uniref:hypothetical protein n=1 Tax=Halomonas sp. TaxID=1486246 RepID=UPI003D135549